MLNRFKLSVFADLIKSGGFTFDVHGNHPKTGYMVALNGKTTNIPLAFIEDDSDALKGGKGLLFDRIKAYVRNTSEFVWFGATVSKEIPSNEIVSFDLLINVPILRDAQLIGRANHQESIYDVVAGKCIDL